MKREGGYRAYLQEDGAPGEAELHTIFGGIIPGEQLQVLYGTVGQGSLHVPRGLETMREIMSTTHSYMLHTQAAHLYRQIQGQQTGYHSVPNNFSLGSHNDHCTDDQCFLKAAHRINIRAGREA